MSNGSLPRQGTPDCTCASHGLLEEYRHGLTCPYGQRLRQERQRMRTGFVFPQSAERGCDASGKEGARDALGQPARYSLVRWLNTTLARINAPWAIGHFNGRWTIYRRRA